MGALFEKLKIELIFLISSKKNTHTTPPPPQSLRRPRRGPERLDEADEDGALGEEVHLVAVPHGRGTKRGGGEEGPRWGGGCNAPRGRG